MLSMEKQAVSCWLDDVLRCVFVVLHGLLRDPATAVGSLNCAKRMLLMAGDWRCRRLATWTPASLAFAFLAEKGERAMDCSVEQALPYPLYMRLPPVSTSDGGERATSLSVPLVRRAEISFQPPWCALRAELRQRSTIYQGVALVRPFECFV